MVRNEDEVASAADQPVAANDNGRTENRPQRWPARKAVRAVHVAANDNSIALAPRVAANDNEILVSDDLPRPLPLIDGEGDLVRHLLGERFRQILVQGDPS